MPKIKIIGETHHAQYSTDFSERAEKLAKEGSFILVCESEVFDDHPGGIIAHNIYAIEDILITAYPLYSSRF